MGESRRMVEVGALLRSIRQEMREKAREHPEGTWLPKGHPPDWTLMRDVLPTLHETVQAIGRVNPRPPGLRNEVIQLGKRFVARGLEWCVRPQRMFNTAVLVSLTTVQRAGEHYEQMLERFWVRLQSLAELQRQENARAAADMSCMQAELATLRKEANAWKEQIEKHAAQITNQLRQMRTELISLWEQEVARFRQEREQQIAQFGAQVEQMRKDLAQAGQELQSLRQRLEERLLTVLSSVQLVEAQTTRLQETVATEHAPVEDDIDYFGFEQEMRGDEESVRQRQSVYVSYFRDRAPVVDLGCGRGEFVELLLAEGIEAWGVDRHPQMVAHCRTRGIPIIEGDLFNYLAQQAIGSLGGIFCAQVVEHLAPRQLIQLLQLAVARLKPEAVAVFETQNPHCLLSIAGEFWIDPSHRHPIHPQQLVFLSRMVGFRNHEILWLNECELAHRLPGLSGKGRNHNERQQFNAAIDRFNRLFLGPRDYALVAWK